MRECEYCSKKVNRRYKVKPCAKRRENLSVHLIYDLNLQTGEKTEPGLVIFNDNWAIGYVDVNYCPICGRKLREDLLNGDE